MSKKVLTDSLIVEKQFLAAITDLPKVPTGVLDVFSDI